MKTQGVGAMGRAYTTSNALQSICNFGVVIFILIFYHIIFQATFSALASESAGLNVCKLALTTIRAFDHIL